MLIPSSVHTIGDSAFENVDGVSLAEGSKAESFGIDVFKGGSGNVHIPGTYPGEITLRTIPIGMFRAYSADSELVIPEGVTEIGAAAFYDFVSDWSLVIPASCLEIDGNVFDYKRQTDGAFHGTKVALAENAQLHTIGAGVFREAFGDLSNLPETLKIIQARAFQYFERRSTEVPRYVPAPIVIPASVHTIAETVRYALHAAAVAHSAVILLRIAANPGFCPAS